MKNLELKWRAGEADSLLDYLSGEVIAAEGRHEEILARYEGKIVRRSRTGKTGTILVPNRPHLFVTPCGYNSSRAYGLPTQFEVGKTYLFPPNRREGPVVLIKKVDESTFAVDFSDGVYRPKKERIKNVGLTYWDPTRDVEYQLHILLNNPLNYRGVNLSMFLHGEMKPFAGAGDPLPFVIGMVGIVKYGGIFYLRDRFGVLTHRLGETIPNGVLPNGVGHYGGLFYRKAPRGIHCFYWDPSVETEPKEAVLPPAEFFPRLWEIRGELMGSPHYYEDPRVFV